MTISVRVRHFVEGDRRRIQVVQVVAPTGAAAPEGFVQVGRPWVILEGNEVVFNNNFELDSSSDESLSRLEIGQVVSELLFTNVIRNHFAQAADRLRACTNPSPTDGEEEIIF